MPAGPHRNYIVIQSQPYTKGPDGGLVLSPVATFWTGYAAIHSPTGSETFRLQQQRVEASHVIDLREYVTGVTEKMQVYFETRTFQIKLVSHDEVKHRWTQLFCVEIK